MRKYKYSIMRGIKKNDPNEYLNYRDYVEVISANTLRTAKIYFNAYKKSSNVENNPHFYQETRLIRHEIIHDKLYNCNYLMEETWEFTNLKGKKLFGREYDYDKRKYYEDYF